MSAPVLVVGSDHRIAITIARSLGARGVTVDAAFPSGIATGSKHIRRVLPLPGLKDGVAVLDALGTHVDRYGYDLLLPTSDLALAALTDHGDELRQRTMFGCPTPDIVQGVLDKERTIAAASSLELALPQGNVTGTDLQAIAGQLEFPAIAKPASKSAPPDVRVLYFATAAEMHAEFQRRRFDVGDFLFQSFCPGVGLGVELLVWQGQPIASFSHRRLEELPMSGGVSVLAEAQPMDETLLEQSLALLRQLDWQGVAMVEYRYEPDTGLAVLMEVNGRYWGSLALSLEAGVEFPWYEWQLRHGATPEPSGYRVGTRVRWTAGQIERLAGGLVSKPPKWVIDKSWLGEVGGFFAGLVNSRDAVWRLNDLPAGWAELRHIMRKVFRALPLPGGFITWLKMPLAAKGIFVWGRANSEPSLQNRRIEKLAVVCHGNIIRSAFAAVRLQQLLAQAAPSVEVLSRGTNASASRADPRAIAAASAQQVDLSGHRPQRMTAEDAAAADLILAMDRFNWARLAAAYPAAKDKIFLFARAAGSDDATVPDPYESDAAAFPECFQRLDTLCRNLAQRIASATSAQAATSRSPRS